MHEIVDALELAIDGSETARRPLSFISLELVQNEFTNFPLLLTSRAVALLKQNCRSHRPHQLQLAGSRPVFSQARINH